MTFAARNANICENRTKGSSRLCEETAYEEIFVACSDSDPEIHASDVIRDFASNFSAIGPLRMAFENRVSSSSRTEKIKYRVFNYNIVEIYK